MFKHVRKTAVFVALVAVLASLFGAVVSGWADGGGLQTRLQEYLLGSAIPPTNSRDNSVYELPEPTSFDQPINVKLIVEAGNLRRSTTTKFWVSNDVQLLTPASGGFTVTDLLVAVDNDPSFGLNFYGANGAPITSQDKYLEGVKYGTGTWTAGQLGYDGWEFRLNDKLPVFTNGTGWTGDSILQTNIVSGDVVHLFYDFPADYSQASGSFAANYVRGIRLSSDSTSLTVQLQGHTTYIAPDSTDPPMYVDNYKNVQAGVTAYLYDATGTTLLDTQVSNLNGRVVFSGTFASGNYIVKTDPVYFPVFSAAITADMYIALTGAYSKVSIP